MSEYLICFCKKPKLLCPVHYVKYLVVLIRSFRMCRPFLLIIHVKLSHIQPGYKIYKIHYNIWFYCWNMNIRQNIRMLFSVSTLHTFCCTLRITNTINIKIYNYWTLYSLFNIINRIEMSIVRVGDEYTLRPNPVITLIVYLYFYVYIKYSLINYFLKQILFIYFFILKELKINNELFYLKKYI